MDEDGLQLWLASLKNEVTLADTRNSALKYIDMFPHVTFLVSGNMDVLGTMLSIAESYLILNAEMVLSVSKLRLYSMNK